MPDDLPDISAGATPVMAQYFAAKRDAADCLVFFRLGDFFELLFNDALIAVELLHLTLTRRGKHNGEDVPMCGVPVRSLETYASRLLRAGHRVAICDQIEADPGSSGIIRRQITRILTPGTLTDEALLDPSARSTVAAVRVHNNEAAVAVVDVSDGEVCVTTLPADQLENLPQLRSIREWVLADKATPPVPEGGVRTLRPLTTFAPQAGREMLKRVYTLEHAEGLGDFSDNEFGALGAVLAYLHMTHRGRLPRLNRPERERSGDLLRIDGASRRNLELTRTLSGERAGSLLACIDYTVSLPGRRRLDALLAAPSCQRSVIEPRQKAAACLVATPTLRADVRALLKGLPDLTRALARLTGGTPQPRDLAAVRDAGPRLRQLCTLLQQHDALPELLRALSAALGLPCESFRKLASALNDDLPATFRDGGIIRPRFDDALDTLRNTGAEVSARLLRLEALYRTQTGVNTLKIKHNQPLGYHIEVSLAAAKKLTDDTQFRHRRSTGSAACFVTQELSDLERRLLDAESALRQREDALVQGLCADVRLEADVLARMAAAAAELDVFAALAELACVRSWVLPTLHDRPRFEVTGGRHPCVEERLNTERRGAFVPNDCHFDNGRTLFLVTGPNTGGKSTYLRQNALMIVLAQIGSFVPAASANLGVFDRLFCRAGASDDPARGRSTFAVEMIEAALILNESDARTFAVIDELGRGTATYDGMALARAAAEHLVRHNRCLTLFATHYHELSVLAKTLPAVGCLSVRAQLHKDELICLHRVVPGAEGRSYGLPAARKAGLPESVVRRAQALLEAYEARAPLVDPDVAALPLFAEDV